VIRTGTFANLPRLSELLLYGNEIGDVEASAFEGAGIIELDLSGQALHTLRQNAFRGMKYLRIITLARNKITDIGTQAFVGCSSVLSLDLSFNNFDEIKTGAFMGLNDLMSLTLTSIRLRNLRSSCFEGLYVGGRGGGTHGEARIGLFFAESF
jgi:Leucine-rich repeat (LRR) protein